MNVRLHIASLIGALVLAQACIYPFEADLEGEETPLVIEGNIQLGATTYIRLSRLKTSIYVDDSLVSSHFPLQEAEEEPDAIPFTAIVEGEDGTSVEASGVGSCALDTSHLPDGQRYRLRVHDGETGENYSSEWLTVAPMPIVDSCKWQISEDRENADFIISFHSDGESPYYSLAYDEDYEYYSLATSTLHWEDGEIVEGEPYPNRICWMTKAKGVNQVVSTGVMVENKLVDFPLRQFTKYDRQLSVRYHLRIYTSIISADAFRYWDNLDKISYQGGDLFAPIPSDVKGNLYCERNPEIQVLGYISASYVDVRDLYFDNTKLGFHRTSPTDKLIIQNSIRADYMVAPYSLWASGYIPYMAVYGDNEYIPLYYQWIKESCVDCRTLGGSTRQPEGWYDLFK